MNCKFLNRYMLFFALVIVTCFACVLLSSCQQTKNFYPNADQITESKALAETIKNSGIDYSNDWKWLIKHKDDNNLPERFATVRDPFQAPSSKYTFGDFVPSREGMDNLNLSGSGQFTINQFPVMLNKIKEYATGPIYDIDLRQECHACVNNDDITSFGINDWAYLGYTSNQTLETEDKIYKEIQGKNIDLYEKNDDDQFDFVKSIQANNIVFEKDMCKQAGINYVRIATTDHTWPDASSVDFFIQYVKSLPKDAWLHIHCAGGTGRTVCFMAIYDMMKNPNISYKDIAARQCLYNRDNISDPSGKGYKSALCKERAELSQLFYKYVQENKDSNYELSWSQWLSCQNN